MAENQCLILTTNDCPGMRVVRIIGPVYGTSIRSRSVVGNFPDGARAVFRGKQSDYIKMFAATRDEALAQLSENAQAMGAKLDCSIDEDEIADEFDRAQDEETNR